jgi:hypothetical protein
LFDGDKAEGKGQKAEERKDFRQKGGYQGGFGITAISLLTLEETLANWECLPNYPQFGHGS